MMCNANGVRISMVLCSLFLLVAIIVESVVIVCGSCVVFTVFTRISAS